MLEELDSAGTYRHCYLSFTRGGWEEVLLTAGTPIKTESASLSPHVEAKMQDVLLLISSNSSC